MNSSQREEVWNSPDNLLPHTIAMMVEGVENGYVGVRREKGKKKDGRYMQVPVWVCLIAGTMLCGLLISNMTLWAFTLSNRGYLINCANDDNHEAMKNVIDQRGQEDKDDGRKKRSATLDDAATIYEVAELEDKLTKKIETQHLSAHLIPSTYYNSIYIVDELSPLMWMHEDFHDTHNAIFRLNVTGYLEVLREGYYWISLTAMFNGRDQATRWTSTSICTLKVKKGKQSLPRHQAHTLMMSSVTQDDRGRPLPHTSRTRYPFDSTHVDGVFKLAQHDVLYVTPDNWSPGCRISMQGPKTHLDAYYLRPIDDE